ncbi:transketolase [Roseobacter sp.]|nr:transketolase [Roseobacter sp.]
MNEFHKKIAQAKQRLLKLHHDANSGHLGGNISCLEALMVLHHNIMKPEDRFILSKGHAAGALYTTLWSLGKLSDADLQTFTRDDTTLPGHPSGSSIPGVMFPTGSLGHGPSLAAGLAMATRYTHKPRHVYCLCSDGEWQEGSCWEALTFAIHHKLDNLTIIIDQNGLQGYGRTKDIISCEDLGPRISSFGAYLQRVDGHAPVAIKQALDERCAGQVSVVILETTKGRGTYFEDTLASHYLPLDDDQFQAAYKALEQGGSL